MRGIVEDEDAASGTADKLDGLNGFDHRCEAGRAGCARRPAHHHPENQLPTSSTRSPMASAASPIPSNAVS